jgi:hypothetical protein
MIMITVPGRGVPPRVGVAAGAAPGGVVAAHPVDARSAINEISAISGARADEAARRRRARRGVPDARARPILRRSARLVCLITTKESYCRLRGEILWTSPGGTA